MLYRYVHVKMYHPAFCFACSTHDDAQLLENTYTWAQLVTEPDCEPVEG